MDVDPPRGLLDAMSRGGFIRSAWPWKAGAFLAGTVVLGLLALIVTFGPVGVLGALAADSQLNLESLVVVAASQLVLVLGFGPWIAAVFSVLEMRRLPVLEPLPTRDRSRNWLAGGIVGYYTAPLTWRRVGYVLLLGTVGLASALTALAVGLIALVYVCSPLIVLVQGPSDPPVALGIGSASSVAEATPYAIVGLLLLPAVPYAWGMVAAGQTFVGRHLLLGPDTNVRAELTEVSRSRARLADAFEAERRRIERDLHDGAQQRLVSLTMQLGLARLDLPSDSPAAVALERAHEQAKSMMVDLRELIRGIQPQVLTDLGLGAAIGELADVATIPVRLSVDLSSRPSPQVENTVYFVVAEALNNVVKHACAAHVYVYVRRERDLIVTEVTDDGVGGATVSPGSGLTGLADRVAAVGGRMLLSSPSGGPTTVRAEIPWHQT